MQGNSPCHHGYMAVALVKQQKGTAYPREMTHSWCRNNFFLPGRHATSPQAGARACVNAWCHWRVVSGPAYGLDGPIGIAAPPTHQSNPPAPYGKRAKRIPMLVSFPVVHTRAQSCSEQTSSGASSSHSLNCSRHSCMFHTHSMITFVLHCKRKDTAQHFLAPHWTREAAFLWEEETFYLQVFIKSKNRVNRCRPTHPHQR